jgi:hypothetical protein
LASVIAPTTVAIAAVPTTIAAAWGTPARRSIAARKWVVPQTAAAPRSAHARSVRACSANLLRNQTGSALPRGPDRKNRFGRRVCG